MHYNFHFMLYTNSNKILIKFSISILMVCCGFSQVRINDTKSITSSLEILDLVQNESSLILGTSGGLSTYDIGTNKFSTFTNDQGLGDVEIKKLFIDLNNLLWIGFQNKIQVWDGSISGKQEIQQNFFEWQVRSRCSYTCPNIQGPKNAG